MFRVGLLTLVVLLSGCAHTVSTTTHMYEGEERDKNELVLLTENNDEAIVLSVDGVPVKRTGMFKTLKTYILPGKHKFEVKELWKHTFPIVGNGRYIDEDRSSFTDIVCINMQKGYEYYFKGVILAGDWYLQVAERKMSDIGLFKEELYADFVPCDD